MLNSYGVMVEVPPVTLVTCASSGRFQLFDTFHSTWYPDPRGLAQIATPLTRLEWAKAGADNATIPPNASAETTPPNVVLRIKCVIRLWLDMATPSWFDHRRGPMNPVDGVGLSRSSRVCTGCSQIDLVE